MKTLWKCIGFAIAVLQLSGAIAQDQCKDILANGIWEYTADKSSTTQSFSFLNWFCSKTFSSREDMQSASASIGIPIGDLPVEIGGNYRDGSWSEYRNALCRVESGRYEYASQISAFARKASASVAEAWVDCTSRNGTQAWLATTESPNAFALQIRRRTDLGTPSFTTEGISVTSGKLSCIPSLSTATNRTYTGSASFLCERTDRTRSFTLLPRVSGLTDPLPPLTVSGYVDLPPTPVSPRISVKIFHMVTGKAGHPQGELAVDPGFKVIGCGARANYGGYGSLLTAVYPTDHNTCYAAAKDHIQPDPATLDIWAVGLSDPNNAWEVRIFTATSSVTAHPSAQVTVDSSYVMTGGGAQVPFGDGYGNMLTATYPLSRDVWMAESKDHIQTDPAALIVYAVGIKPTNPKLPLPKTQLFGQSSAVAGHPIQAVAVTGGFTMTSGGARDDYRGMGNMLVGSFPANDTTWVASGKDHVQSDPADLFVYAIGIASSDFSSLRSLTQRLNAEERLKPKVR